MLHVQTPASGLVQPDLQGSPQQGHAAILSRRRVTRVTDESSNHDVRLSAEVTHLAATPDVAGTFHPYRVNPRASVAVRHAALGPAGQNASAGVNPIRPSTMGVFF